MSQNKSSYSNLSDADQAALKKLSDGSKKGMASNTWGKPPRKPATDTSSTSKKPFGSK